MKKFMLLFAVTVLLVSCGNLPEKKLDLAGHCIDSLKTIGAENSLKFIDLQNKMKEATDAFFVQQKLLFKTVKDVNKSLDEVIIEARSFVITNDKPLPRVQIVEPVNPLMNTYSFEVEIDMNKERVLTANETLELANKIDQEIRGIMSPDIKLIRVRVK